MPAEKAQTLEELQEYLRSNPSAFFNHPGLLQEIQGHIWDDFRWLEEETDVNTKDNSKYKTCTVLYSMRRIKKKETPGTPHDPQKVRFTPPLPLETSRPHRKKNDPFTSMLKQSAVKKKENPANVEHKIVHVEPVVRQEPQRVPSFLFFLDGSRQKTPINPENTETNK